MFPNHTLMDNTLPESGAPEPGGKTSEQPLVAPTAPEAKTAMAAEAVSGATREAAGDVLTAPDAEEGINVQLKRLFEDIRVIMRFDLAEYSEEDKKRYEELVRKLTIKDPNGSPRFEQLKADDFHTPDNQPIMLILQEIEMILEDEVSEEDLLHKQREFAKMIKEIVEEYTSEIEAIFEDKKADGRMFASEVKLMFQEVSLANPSQLNNRGSNWWRGFKGPAAVINGRLHASHTKISTQTETRLLRMQEALSFISEQLS